MLVGIAQFYLRDGKPLEAAMEFIDFPTPGTVAGLADYWRLRAAVDHLTRVICRDFVFPFIAHYAVVSPLDGQKSTVARYAYAHSGVNSRRQIRL